VCVCVYVCLAWVTATALDVGSRTHVKHRQVERLPSTPPIPARSCCTAASTTSARRRCSPATPSAWSPRVDRRQLAGRRPVKPTSCWCIGRKPEISERSFFCEWLFAWLFVFVELMSIEDSQSVYTVSVCMFGEWMRQARVGVPAAAEVLRGWARSQQPHIQQSVKVTFDPTDFSSNGRLSRGLPLLTYIKRV
jgi:hypothetical protein